MGDRANIAVQFDGKQNKRVWLYTHWGGSDLDQTLAAALDRGRGRWNDDQYLARIIFCEMIQGSVLDETGYGIGVEPGDNEYPFLVVDCKTNTVFREPDTRKGYNIAARKEADLKPVPFADFVEKHLATASA